MKTFLLLISTFFLSSIGRSYALEIPKMSEDNIAPLISALDGMPVLVRDTDNVVGVITENLHNFPMLPNISEIPTSRDINVLTDFSNTNPDSPVNLLSINLSGTPTLVPLVEWQRKIVEQLRGCSKNPVAVYEQSEQILVTPDGKETPVKLKIAKWQIL